MHPQRSLLIRFHHALRLLFVVPIPAISITVFVLTTQEVITHPFCNKYPEMQISPGVPRATILPLVLISLVLTCGWTFPTVSMRLMIGSAGVVWKETGLVSAGYECYNSEKKKVVQKSNPLMP